MKQLQFSFQDDAALSAELQKIRRWYRSSLCSDILKAVFGRENLYRIGGDEFIAILEGEGRERIAALFEELDAALEEAARTENVYRVPLSMSKGLSAYEKVVDREYREVFRRADDAMYADKAEYYKEHDRRRH